MSTTLVAPPITASSALARPQVAAPSFGLAPFRACPSIRVTSRGPGRGRPTQEMVEARREAEKYRQLQQNGQGMPDPYRWAGQVARCSLEIIEGLRAPSQMSRWLHQDLFQALQKRAIFHQLHTPESKVGPVCIKMVRLCAVGKGAQEASVVLFDGCRSRAVALRLEPHRGHWLTTALEIV